MEFATSGGSCIGGQQDRVERSGDRQVSASGKASVEERVVLLGQVQDFHLVEMYICVESHVSEMVPADAAAHRTCLAESVIDLYVLEFHAVAVQ